jgi:iron(III) transport system substrate-binding protein
MPETLETTGDLRAVTGARVAARRLSRRLVTGLALGAGAVVLAAGCGGSTESDTGASAKAPGTWAETVAAAEKEGKVTIYSGQGTEQLEDLAARFEKKYPKIDAEVVRAVETDLAPKVEAEARTGKGIADLFVMTDRAWLDAHKDAFIAARGPAFDNPAYNRAEHQFPGNYFLIDATILTFAWNTERFAGKLNDYSSLLDPALAGGKIGIVPADGAARVDFYRYLAENYGEDFLTKLAAQRPRIYPSALPMAQALSSGEIAAATMVEPQIDEKKAGAPVEWGLAQPAWGARFHGAVLGSAPHPSAAQLLADFIVTPEGQAAIARKAASVLPDIPGTVDETANVRKPDPADLTPDKVRDYQATWNELFQS